MLQKYNEMVKILQDNTKKSLWPKLGSHSTSWGHGTTSDYSMIYDMTMVKSESSAVFSQIP
jgi:hypothetical protein